MGWSRKQWKRLSEAERFDWLAFEVYREHQIEGLIQGLQELDYADTSAYMMLFLERL